MGAFHLSIAYNLIKNNCFPSIISGSSSGSIMGMFLGTRTKEEVIKEIEEGFPNIDMSMFEN